MRVLLLSDNHTVREMVSLALREVQGAELVTASAADQVEPTTYDLIFVDDALPSHRESIALMQTLGVETIVILAQAGNTEADRFERVLRKPFLPAEIRAEVHAHLSALDAAAQTPASPHKKKKNKKKKKTHPATRVLDIDEIETIKSLLEEEGLEIVHEEELIETVSGADKPQPDDTDDPHEALLRALRTCKPKKLRKLLKGATIRLEITFPGDTQ